MDGDGILSKDDLELMLRQLAGSSLSYVSCHPCLKDSMRNLGRKSLVQASYMVSNWPLDRRIADYSQGLHIVQLECQFTLEKSYSKGSDVKVL